MASLPKAVPACPPEVQKVSCGMKSLLELVTGPWTLHILSLFMTNGPMRFGVIRRSIDGISPRLLTVRLRALEERGLVIRSVKPSNPPEVTYTPTSRLRNMRRFLEQLHLLAIEWEREDEKTIPRPRKVKQVGAGSGITTAKRT
jgi:DNA-binding HxlR family transcriptional regulator